jgi:hypothetical protein
VDSSVFASVLQELQYIDVKVPKDSLEQMQFIEIERVCEQYSASTTYSCANILDFLSF